MTTTVRQIDAITLEVIRNRLDAIATEMQTTLLKSAYSSTIKEGWDASAALFDLKAQTMVQAPALPAQLGMIIIAVERLVQVFPPASMAEGDVYVLNDPYDGGSHLPDICIAAPVFYNGQLVAVAASLAHHQDVGGAVPGSTNPGSTDIYQEGLRIPPLKLYDRGQCNQALLDLFTRNTRLPDSMLGDLRAQLACANVGARRLCDLLDDYGVDTIQASVDELMDYSERLTRQALLDLPDGRATFVDYLDNDGVDLEQPVRIEATVEIKGDELLIDFSGSSPQAQGALNSVPSGTLASVYYVARAITDPFLPHNAGCFRPIKVTMPSGTIVNPLPPAAVSVRTITIKRIVDVLLGALAQIIPDRVHAASCGQAAVFHVGGVDPETRRPYVTMIGVPIAGGMGARPTKDGIDVIDTDMTNLMSQPVEATESEYPVRIHYCRLWSDSGGAGRMRGGLGYEALCELERGNATMTHRRDRHNFQPWGLLGGEAAPVSKTVIIRSDGTELSLPSKTVVRLAQGDQVRIFTAGGGGYGDPLERPARAVLDDVVNGRVSPEAAFERYGVVLRPEGAAVDEPATQARRETLNAQRGPMAWTFDRGETFPSRVGRPRWE